MTMAITAALCVAGLCYYVFLAYSLRVFWSEVGEVGSVELI